jgi:phage-related tail protein
VHSAVALQDQKKELAGVIALVEKGSPALEDLHDKADELNESLERVATTTGNTKESMIRAFEVIGARTNKGAAFVEDMTTKMAEASKSLPGGIEAMSESLSMLESGFVRPNNAIVQLIRQMGIAKGSAHDIAKGLMKMMQSPGGEEKVFEIAERAITAMAEKTKSMPLTFSQLMNSLSTFRESLFETVGTPVVEALGAQFNRLQGYLQAHREEIEQLAKTMGERVGEWVTKAAELIERGFQYLRTHADDIMTSLENGAKALRSVLEFMVAHRQLILGLALAHTAGKPLGALAGGIAEALPGAGAAAGRMMGGAWGSLVGGAGAIGLGAGAVAAIAWKAAYDQSQQLEKDTGMSMLETLRELTHGLAGATNRLANFKAETKAFDEELAKGVDASGERLEHLESGLEHIRRGAEIAGSAVDRFTDQLLNVQRKLEHQAGVENAIARMAAFGSGASIFGGAQTLANAYREAAEQDEKAATEQARRILAANEQLRTALGAIGVEDALVRLKALAEGKVTGDAVKLPPISFGPTTFNIHQDFRDQDPDRVAIVFRKDITRQATSRIGSRLQTPFGY